MWNLENTAVCGNFEYVYSRFIASWVKVCRKLKRPVYFGTEFKSWLSQINGLPEEDIKNICEMADMGKMELEDDARRFLEKQSKNEY